MAILTTITGTVQDTDNVLWINCTWKAEVVAPFRSGASPIAPAPPSNAALYSDGSPVVATFGQADASGVLSGQIPRTSEIFPSGSTLRITVSSVTSAPAQVINGLSTSTASFDLGSYLSTRLAPPRIQAAPIVYAYDQSEVLSPRNGDGFINTTTENFFVWVGVKWVQVSGLAVMVYPPIGLGVSTGAAWAASIDPATVPRLGAANVFTAPQTAPYISVDSTAAPISNGMTLDWLGSNVGRLIAITAAGSATVPDILLVALSGDGASYHEVFRYRASSDEVEIGANFTVSGTKGFRTVHPFESNLSLCHACLEGPENGVFYRGEATTKRGGATVTLPDYFEALTFPEDRSVLLTQIDEGKDELAVLAASRIEDGKFHIRATIPAVRVAWEVKAVRRVGAGRLEPVTQRIQRD